MALPIPSDLIDKICEGSESQLCATIKPRLQALKGREDDQVKEDLLGIIGDCINYDLCSGFVLVILQKVFYADCCGGDINDAVGKIRVRPVG